MPTPMSEFHEHGGIRFEVAQRSDMGLVRSNNEDALIVSPEHGLYGVCDGMGGHAAGEIASSLASKALSEQVSCCGTSPGEALREGIELANSRIFEEQAQRPEYSGMGTTVSALWISPNSSAGCWVVHVGDSRIYRLNEGRFNQITSDHSPVFRLYQQGHLNKDEMRRHPHKNLLDRSLGVMPMVEPDVFETDFQAGDTFLICSDGLTDELTDREIEEILTRNTLERAADQLVSQAKATGGRDNISLILIRILEA